MFTNVTQAYIKDTALSVHTYRAGKMKHNAGGVELLTDKHQPQQV